MNSKIAIAAATSALLLGSTAVAQTTTTEPATGTTTADPATGTTTTTTDPATSAATTGAATTGSAPNVSGDLNTQLTVAPAQGTVDPAVTQSTIATGSTRTTTNVTVQPKAAPPPVATGAGEVQAGERG